MSDERFIPFLRSEVTALCAADTAPGDRDAAAEATRLLAGVLHQRYRRRLREVEADYYLLHPPEYARGEEPPAPAARDRARARLGNTLAELADTAAYTRIPQEELAASLRSHALLRVRMEIPEQTQSGAVLYRRGRVPATARVRTWWGLRTKDIEYELYSRVLVYVHTAEVTALKLFEDVPRDDIEMLLPGVRPRMRLADKLLIVVPALVSGVALVATKLISAIGLLILLLAFWVGLRDSPVQVNRGALLTVGAGLVALGSYVARQYRKYTRRRLQFMNTLTDNLYYRNLDNDAGVFYRLLGAAEDADYALAMLAYRELRDAGGPLTPRELAAAVEARPELQRGREFRFAADDALATLEELGLAFPDGAAGADGAVGRRAVPPAQARDHLRRLWHQSAE
ncbi:TMEM143 family protein [Tomitella fengzijianii]|uniref:TMEM143 family protein n=1 Tax=Tomitella fengzijianii TaxID=2597660 RepID=UPI00131D7780|nr:TMEM143 family protein [Tomitella fengzijianii]